MATMQAINSPRFRNTRILAKCFALAGFVIGAIIQASVGIIAQLYGAHGFAWPILMAIPLMAAIVALPSATVGAIIGLTVDLRTGPSHKSK